MTKHLIVLDLDGTLLKNNKTISYRTLQTLRRLREKGHLVAIATGRSYRASKMYYQQLGLDTPIVNFNGAFVHHPLHSFFPTYHSPLDLEVAKMIIDTCQRFQVNNILAEVLDEIYVHSYDETFTDLFAVKIRPNAYGNLKQLLTEDPTSLLVYPQEETAEQLRQLISGKHAKWVEQRSWGAPYYMIEIIRSGNNKANGLRKVASYCNIEMENIIAFGDENNDLEMLAEVGEGVAMANGSKEAKQAADAITLSNEEDGVAVYLEEKFNLPAPTT
ncbi:Cof-type HAD-IIB family hydrolase [Aliibacillus thermotolerans]|uniref:Cof-type HAD-IIB family hydrolase n=1 Tax=Aliibacillus thermotolerans TaxID=1834418 RepID=A0ABW0U301_9BACI|nr:Cof-type HAD-IIB family hydrolase [Aliibacillus thermotolerans]MDA3129181.1 Cof-type HAD-IIB family hydrolase [Aliibacillus thermotolerans]